MTDSSSLIQLLLARLERISADSPLAHRASGVRGALLRSVDDIGAEPAVSQVELRRAVDAAMDILRLAAGELRAGGPIDARKGSG